MLGSGGVDVVDGENCVCGEGEPRKIKFELQQRCDMKVGREGARGCAER
jgi:hypothetical protein